MIYTPLTIKAMQFAYEKHAGQVDKAGLPYIMHPLHVAERMINEDETVVALLHDVMEDTDTTAEELIEAGFTERQVKALQALTHEKGVPYMEYLKKQVACDDIAIMVKIHDLAHNMDLTRLGDKVTPKDQERVKMKYSPACSFLQDIVINRIMREKHIMY